MQKLKPYRNKKILAAAKNQDCTLNFPGCTNDIETTVACHLDGKFGRLAGKGMGQKAGDNFVMFGCAHCHSKLGTNVDPNYLLTAILKTNRILREEGIIE